MDQLGAYNQVIKTTVALTVHTGGVVKVDKEENPSKKSTPDKSCEVVKRFIPTSLKQCRQDEVAGISRRRSSRAPQSQLLDDIKRMGSHTDCHFRGMLPHLLGMRNCAWIHFHNQSFPTQYQLLCRARLEQVMPHNEGCFRGTDSKRHVKMKIMYRRQLTQEGRQKRNMSRPKEVWGTKR